MTQRTDPSASLAITRRALLAAGLAVPAMAAGETLQAQPRDASLAELAAKQGLLYGCAAVSTNLVKDPGFAQLVAGQAGILVPEGELKRRAVQPQEGVFDFRGADALAAFAAAHGQRMRGHTLVWHYGLPDWLDRKLQDEPDDRLLTDMITQSCRHFRGRMHSWDVVNEVVEPKQGSEDGLRVDSPWRRAFGDSYIATAFHAARAADPHALLFYNEYWVEMSAGRDERRRGAVLRLLEKLKKQNVPIDGFGIQGHLDPFKADFNEATFERFLRDVAGMGLKLMITELDATDRNGPADAESRDAAVASFTRRFLDVALDNAAMLGVLTWGITDRYSWLSSEPKMRRQDGLPSRGLPYDADLRPKRMRAALAEALKARG